MSVVINYPAAGGGGGSGGGGGNVATDNLWQAAGDLAVGTGLHTASRLGIGSALQVLQVDSGATGLQWVALSGGGNALTSNPLSQFASTTSSQLAGIMADETGTGSLVFANGPILTLQNSTGLPLTTGVTGLLPVANGGTGTASPGIVAGTNITVTGTWPNQTVNSSAGGGTVTNSTNLTSNSLVLGTGTTGTQAAAGLGSDGVSKINLGVAGTSVGSIAFSNATSGSITLAPATGALGAVTLTMPAVTDTIVGLAATQTLTNKTLTAPTLTAPVLGTPASGTLTNATGLPVATGISGLGTGVATMLATPSSANIAAACTDETGSGSLVFGTAPTISAANLTGIVTTNGANVTTAAAMGALAIDVTKGLNTKSIAADSTFTFSGTPATTDTWFGCYITNTDTNPHIVTIPSSFSVVTQAARTTFPLAASGKAWLMWRYDGTNYNVFGDSPYLSNFAATTNPAVTDDVADGYGPGSLWGNTSANSLYWCESNAAGAAVWNLVAGSGSGDMLLASAQTVTGAKTFNDATLVLAGSTSGTTTLHSAAVASTSSMTFPAGTDTVATLAATQALTNKTYEGNTWTAGTATLTGSAGKTLTWQNSLILAGTDGTSFTFPGSNDTIVGRTSTQTLTNKTLTSPSITSPTLTTPVLGTPTSGTLTNCTGLPISTGVSGLGTNVATMLATFSSANIASACTDETGTGSLVFSASPALTGTPTVGGATIAVVNTISTQSAAYTFVLADANTTIMHPSADTTARTWTIPANGSVAYPTGTILHIKNQLSAGTLTIAITTDTLTWARAAGGTGSRTLAAGGEASIMKVDSTHWEIVGTPELS